MHGSNNVEFNGVLVDRQFTSGQRCAQLVFETAEGVRLSISRNIAMARSLSIGLTYKVKGPEYSIGEKHYIHEPTATLVPAEKSSLLSKRYKVLIPVTISLVVVLGGVGTFAFASQGTGTSGQPTASEQKPAVKSASKTASSTNTPTTTEQSASETTEPSVPQQQTAMSSTSSSKKASSSTATTKPVTPNQSVATPVADTPVVPATQQDLPAPTPITEQPAAETPPPVDPPTIDPQDVS